MTGGATPLVTMRGISKSFGNLRANRDVDLTLYRGEVHSLLGENGAGKSTLMNILFGMYRPDAGRIEVDGTPVSFGSPRDALARGIGMVHQHFMLVPDFTVAENVALGGERRHRLGLRRTRVTAEVAELAERFGMHLDVRTPVRLLSVEQQQQVEILKLLYRGADLLILDEPTAVLGPVEIERLFVTLRRLCDAGRGVVIITHKLTEVLSVADRITVLRQGAVAATARSGELDRAGLALAMLGRELPALPARRPHPDAEPPTVLEVEGLSLPAGRSTKPLHDVRLRVSAGEIVGITGVEGNGQTELMRALSGLATPSSGTVRLRGRDVTGISPRRLRAHGVGIVTDDRLRWDAVTEMSLEENLALVDVPAGRFSRFGLLRGGRMRVWARRLLDDHDVSPPDPQARMGALSGGNQQKVVIARELAHGPDLLLASHPVRGLDAGAADFVFRRIVELRDRGSGILLNSADLDELWAVADRVVVLNGGRVALEGRTEDLTIDQVAEAMTGGDVPSAVGRD
ncbi:ABC transporter ATP-binding protein [Microbispora sp. H10836]|uniref:ABC transporter ATP-binding protein n=1 Tax=Microbispora sp. H10836 TaxID=2729106 RepID=UPI00147412F9|nr:ABC transporter ATP-binding protein [Microbispora sp. H10836]